jgi:phage gp29-like protein
MLLAQAKAAGGQSAIGDSQAAPEKPPVATLTNPTPEAKGPMLAVLRPNIRDRWLASQLSYFTPTIVENTVRGAMAGNLLAQWLMFDLMEQTWPRLNANLNTLKDAVVDLDWPIQAFALRGDKPSPEAQRRAKTIAQAVWQMKPEADADECDLEDTQRDVMDAVGKGIAVSEILWMEPGDPDNVTGLWMPRATKWVHPRYYGYPQQPGTDDRLMLDVREVKLSNPTLDVAQLFADGAPVNGLPTSIGMQGIYARFPRDQFIISMFKRKSGHPVSGAMLRLLGFFWSCSNFCWEYALNLAQMFGVPIRWATYSTGTGQAETIRAVEEMLENMGSAGWAAFPEGTKLEVIEALQNAKDNPAKAFIDAADIIADIVILGQTLTTQQGERGSQALGTVHKQVRDEKIQSVAKRVAKILNGQFLPAICRMNFGDDRECPWFQPSTKESKDVGDAAIRYKTLLSIPGIRISRQQFYEDNDLVVPDEKDEVIVGQATGGIFGGKGTETDENPDPNADAKENGESATAKAKSAATEKLSNNVLENLTGVEAKWLGGVKPYFRRLCATALSSQVTDAEFIATLEKARKEMPELFNKLDGKALAKAMEDAMGAAVVNGAVRGAMKR